jgi:MoaA/NifB/PqqE/SkfB family radical SAM enzyme
MHLPVHGRPLKWLEISADYRCNNRCVGCFSAQGDGASMTSREAVEELAIAYRRGARSLWLGGGEPTLRGDMLGVVRAARRMGYARVKVQTNGMRLAYADYAKACADAGVTEVSFSIKGATEDTHDHLTRTAGCHALMLEAMGRVRDLGLAMEGDLLIYRSNAGELPAMVRAYFERGVARFNVWLFSSAAAQGDASLDAEVPRIEEVVRGLDAARAMGLSPRADFITSLHTPACTLPGALRGMVFHAAELDMLVANPGGHRFRLEESAIEGGHYAAGCAGCSERARCGGARADYVRIHGDAEFVAV